MKNVIKTIFILIKIVIEVLVDFVIGYCLIGFLAWLIKHVKKIKSHQREEEI